MSSRHLLTLLYILGLDLAPLAELAYGNKSAIEAEQMGRQAVEDDTAWLDSLPPAKKELARRHLLEHP